MSRESFGEERLEECRGAPAPVLVGHLCVQLCLSHRHLLRVLPSPCARCWQKLGGGRRVQGREGGRESENEREKEADKMKKTPNLTALVIFSDKS